MKKLIKILQIKFNNNKSLFNNCILININKLII